MHVFIEFKVIRRHIKIATMNFTQAYISGTDQKVTFRKTHGSRAIEATTALVKNQLPMPFPQLIDNCLGPIFD